MARMPDESALRAEALQHGRELPEPSAWLLVELPDDEIDSHLEGSDLLYALPAPRRPKRHRRPTRH